MNLEFHPSFGSISSDYLLFEVTEDILNSLKDEPAFVNYNSNMHKMY